MLYLFLLWFHLTAHAEPKKQLSPFDCPNLLHATEVLTEGQMMSAFIEKFSKEHKIFYSSRFRRHELISFEEEFQIRQSMPSTYIGDPYTTYDSRGMRKILRDIQVDPANYQNRITGVSKRLFNKLRCDLINESPSAIARFYSLSNEEYRRLKSEMLEIEREPMQRGVFEKLLFNIALNSIDSLITETHLKKMSYRLTIALGKYRCHFFKLLMPLLPNAYVNTFRWLGSRFTNPLQLKIALNKIKNDPLLLESNTILLNRSIPDEIAKITYENLSNRFRIVPQAGLLDRYLGISQYHLAWALTLNDLFTRATFDFEQFARPVYWNQSVNEILSSFSASVSNAEKALSLKKIKNYVSNYQIQMKNMLWAIVVAKNTLKQMNLAVDQKLAGFNPEEGEERLLLRNELNTLMIQHVGFDRNLDSLNILAQEQLKLSEDKLNTIHSVEMSLLQSSLAKANDEAIKIKIESLRIIE